MNETTARKAFNTGSMNQLAPPTERQLAIPEALDRLQKVVAILQEQTDSFLHRLAPIIRQEPADDRLKNPTSPAYTCTLVNPIHSACDNIEETLRRINACRDALEL
jgi:hypothetical protein